MKPQHHLVSFHQKTGLFSSGFHYEIGVSGESQRFAAQAADEANRIRSEESLSRKLTSSSEWQSATLSQPLKNLSLLPKIGLRSAGRDHEVYFCPCLAMKSCVRRMISFDFKSSAKCPASKMCTSARGSSFL